MKRSLRELSIDMVIDGGIFTNNQITLFPSFTFTSNTEVSFYRVKFLGAEISLTLWRETRLDNASDESGSNEERTLFLKLARWLAVTQVKLNKANVGNIWSNVGTYALAKDTLKYFCSSILRESPKQMFRSLKKRRKGAQVGRGGSGAGTQTHHFSYQRAPYRCSVFDPDFFPPFFSPAKKWGQGTSAVSLCHAFPPLTAVVADFYRLDKILVIWKHSITIYILNLPMTKILHKKNKKHVKNKNKLLFYAVLDCWWWCCLITLVVGNQHLIVSSW